MHTSDQPEQSPNLIRGIGLGGATALNMIDMIGVGPFITIPLIISAMAGPQAMLGWIFGAALAICDGLVWAELGAAMPNSGGSYGYLKEIYGPERLGRQGLPATGARLRAEHRGARGSGACGVGEPESLFEVATSY